MILRALASFSLLLLLAGCGPKTPANGAPKTVLRVGHFPNITHAQAVIASELTRQGKGWFEPRLGPGIEVQWFVYNAGPSAMEALFVDSIDLTYIGPGPVLNAYARASGDEVRVVAGSAVGGASLVVHANGAIKKPEDFRGKTIATPQLGNTQDVACRVWLRKHGFKVNQLGGDVHVLPTANPDQLSLFQQGVLDAVWTVEPWVSRLEREADGKIFLEQKDAVGTVLATSVKMVTEHEDLVRKFVAAHAELTDWINQHPDEAKALFRQGLKSITRREFSAALTDHAWPRLRFTSKIDRASFDTLLAESQAADFLKDSPPLDRLLALPAPEKPAAVAAIAP